jgi:metal-dependent amidase/aminoacylase/carboxypeptidase family protein
MHACGHDLHTACWPAPRSCCPPAAKPAGDVVFMFQPGEEGYDGARHMIAEGVLDATGTRPSAAYALHVTSSGLLPRLFATRPGR